MKVARSRSAHQVGRLDRRARKERRIDADHALDPVRRHHRGAPGHEPAPVVADDHALADLERVEHPDDIGDQVPHRECFDRLGTVGLSVAALVGSDRAKARGRERANLMAPRVPHLGKAVAHHDREAAPRLVQMHPDAVGVDELVLELAHLGLPLTEFSHKLQRADARNKQRADARNKRLRSGRSRAVSPLPRFAD